MATSTTTLDKESAENLGSLPGSLKGVPSNLKRFRADGREEYVSPDIPSSPVQAAS